MKKNTEKKGLWAKMKDRAAENEKVMARSGMLGFTSSVGDTGLVIEGKKYDHNGATASMESGASVGGRITATRVAAGAVILGPLGAVLGGMAKKDRNKVYLVVELADGSVVTQDYPAKDEAKVREFVSKINASVAYLAQNAEASE